jgi:hypothetical protein
MMTTVEIETALPLQKKQKIIISPRLRASAVEVASWICQSYDPVPSFFQR